MQHLEGSGTHVLYIGRTVFKVNKCSVKLQSYVYESKHAARAMYDCIIL
jgi:hypothetical protein